MIKKITFQNLLLCFCLVLIILFMGCVSKKEKESYNKALKNATIAEYKKYLEDFPKGHYAKEIKNLLAAKVFDKIKNTQSFMTLESFISEYPDTEESKQAREIQEKFKAEYENNQEFKDALNKMESLMKTGNIRESLSMGDKIFGNYPEIFTKYGFLLQRVGDILCNTVQYVKELKMDAPIKEKMKHMLNFKHLYAVALKFKRYEIAKAALFRAILEIHPYYYSKRAIMLKEMLRTLDEKMGPKDFMYLSQKIKNDFSDTIKMIEKQKFFLSVKEFLEDRSEDRLKNLFYGDSPELNDAEEKFVVAVFNSAISSGIDRMFLLDIFTQYSHSCILDYIAKNAVSYIDYRIADMTINLGENLREPLLKLLDSGSFNIRINALIAFAWLPVEENSIKKIKTLLPTKLETVEEKIQKMAVDFVLERIGVSKSLESLFEYVFSKDYNLCSQALSLLRYTSQKIPADKAHAVCKHIDSGNVIDPKAKTIQLLQIKALLTNRIQKVLGGVIQNSQYSDAIGEIIFEKAGLPYDGGEGEEIRAEWVEAAKKHSKAISPLARIKIKSENILMSKLAIDILLTSKDQEQLGSLKEMVENEIIPAWGKNKNKFFKPFVKEEVKGRLADRQKTTFYPYYIPYASIYGKLVDAYMNEALAQTKNKLGLTFGVNPDRIVTDLGKGENLRFNTLMGMNETTPGFLGKITNLFTRPLSKNKKIACAAILANRGDINAFKYLLKEVGEVSDMDEISSYLSVVRLTPQQLDLIREKLTELRKSFDNLPEVPKTKGKKGLDFEDRIARDYVPGFYLYHKLSSILAKNNVSII